MATKPSPTITRKAAQQNRWRHFPGDVGLDWSTFMEFPAIGRTFVATGHVQIELIPR
jgi:hypothetical protein